MDFELVEKYDKLSDLKVGQMAISKDREHIFAKVWLSHPDNDKGVPVYEAVVELTDLYNQYPDNRNIEQPVLTLNSGDRVVFTV